MTIDYDPFSRESMGNPHPAYKEMRAEGCPHFIKKRQAWALTLFDDVRKVSLKSKWLDYTAGQTPSQVMLGDPVPHTFMTMNVPENRGWRELFEPFYTKEAVAASIPRIKEEIDAYLLPLRGKETIDVYRDFGSRVMADNAAYNFGLSSAEAVMIRDLLERIILKRQPDQLGLSTEDSLRAAGEMNALLMSHVQKMRADPDAGGPQGKVARDAVVNGHSLTDEELVNHLFTFMVVGSETTPMVVGSALYYLDKHPEQKKMLLENHDLALAAYRETLRYDQPTNMLARRAAMDFEINSAEVKKGDNLLFIYASANRDERRFERADAFDITRENKGDLSFGIGAHYCLGAELALAVGEQMLKAFLREVSDYSIVEEGCKRSFGEHIQGFIEVKVRPVWK